MRAWMHVGWFCVVVLGWAPYGFAQDETKKETKAPEVKLPAPTPTPPPPAATAVAATVNGQDILEMAVYRGLLREHPKNWDAVRKEILNYLIDNTLIDQYLTQLKIEVDPKELDTRFNQIKEEAKKSKQDFEEMLKRLHLTEPDLRKELVGALRWDNFVLKQGTDKVLEDYFTKNLAMFDGRQMQARHVLIAAKSDAEAGETIGAIKKNIEDDVAKELAKLPADTDKITAEKERNKAITAAFAAAAMKQSTCPSSKQGGDLGFFPRAGAMVEPFARAAFNLKPFQMSDAVKTEFGYHLILAVDQKPGREVKFEQVKSFVQEVYGERLREAILASYKPRSKIVIGAK